MPAPRMPSAPLANEDHETPAVTFMAALCDWHDWDQARRAAQAPGVGKEKDSTGLTAGTGSCELIEAAARRDFHGGDLLVFDL